MHLASRWQINQKALGSFVSTLDLFRMITGGLAQGVVNSLGQDYPRRNSSGVPSVELDLDDGTYNLMITRVPLNPIRKLPNLIYQHPREKGLT
jgi:hypothetical protein